MVYHLIHMSPSITTIGIGNGICVAVKTGKAYASEADARCVPWVR